MAAIKQMIYMRRNRLKSLPAAGLILLIWTITIASTGPSQPTISKEYQIKAVFLFNFSQFVEWPANSFPEAKTPLVIGILGNNPFGNYLSETLKGEKINGRSLQVQYYRNAEDIRTCHILFINEHPGDRAEQILSGLKGRSILTVSDASNFIQQGGMIRFFTENNKIRIQINPETAKASNLSLSSGLLRLADITK